LLWWRQQSGPLFSDAFLKLHHRVSVTNFADAACAKSCTGGIVMLLFVANYEGYFHRQLLQPRLSGASSLPK